MGAARRLAQSSLMKPQLCMHWCHGPLRTITWSSLQGSGGRAWVQEGCPQAPAGTSWEGKPQQRLEETSQVRDTRSRCGTEWTGDSPLVARAGLDVVASESKGEDKGEG